MGFIEIYLTVAILILVVLLQCLISILRLRALYKDLKGSLKNTFRDLLLPLHYRWFNLQLKALWQNAPVVQLLSEVRMLSCDTVVKLVMSLPF